MFIFGCSERIKLFTENLAKMATELAELAPPEIIRAMSQDSEFDDALAVPDSLEITVDENGEMKVCKGESECTDNKGRSLYF